MVHTFVTTVGHDHHIEIPVKPSVKPSHVYSDWSIGTCQSTLAVGHHMTVKMSDELLDLSL